jgi:hypothetical protein
MRNVNAKRGIGDKVLGWLIVREDEDDNRRRFSTPIWRTARREPERSWRRRSRGSRR